MDITLEGDIFIHFIKGVFENNKKIGSEFIINPNKSDKNIIFGLKKLGFLIENKFIILNNNHPIDMNKTDVKYIAHVKFIITNTTLKLDTINITSHDNCAKPDKKLHTNIYLNKYVTGKDKTIESIMDIIKNS